MNPPAAHAHLKIRPALAPFADWGIPGMTEEKYKLKRGERPLESFI